MPMSSDDAVVETIKLSGFDPAGEPEIRRFASGQLRIVFNFMPLSTTEATDGALGPYRDFDQEMAHAIGVPVLWEDREIFLIESPRPDTVDRVSRFVSSFRARS